MNHDFKPFLKNITSEIIIYKTALYRRISINKGLIASNLTHSEIQNQGALTKNTCPSHNSLRRPLRFEITKNTDL